MPRRNAPPAAWLPGIEWTGAAVALEPADQAERQLALDPQRSFIVQAPAGSGKTELLMQRFLVLLARVEQPESIVAITFTVKAAGEMRARVLDTLRHAADGVEPSSSHERVSAGLAREALAQDSRRGWSLLDNPGRLRIQTIDALSMSIASQMPWLSRLGAMPRVSDDVREMYREAAQRAVEMLGGSGQLASAVACLLQHLDNDAARTVDLLARMLETRDHWLRVVVAAGGKPEAVRQVLETSLERIVSSHLRRLSDAVPTAQRDELVSLLRYAAANVTDTDPVLAACSDVAALPECVEHWLGVRKLLFTASGEWRKNIDRRTGFPPHDRAEKRRWESLKFELERAHGFAELLAAVTQLPASRYDEAQWQVLSALFRLLPVTAAHLRSVFTESARVDFVEIASAALQALGNPAQPTDLALTLGSRIEHLLVDEFQDTSVTQFELLRALTAGWEDDARRTLFLVGDPMQSIYRFRQAEVELFLNVRASGLGALEPHPVTLSVNFRQGRRLVEWVNQVFASVFQTGAEGSAGAVDYAPSVAFREGDADATVAVHPFLERDDAGEANLVSDLVRRNLREWPGSRLAVLVRSRSHLITIADRLRQDAVPYRAIEIQTLAEKPVVQDILALTQALLHLGDRVAWLAILRAPWCGLTLASLYRIAGDDRTSPIWDRVRAPDLALDSDEARRLGRIIPVLARALAARGRIPVAQLVERTWTALGGAELADDNGLADARACFDLLEELGANGDIADLELLAARAQELFANPDAEADGAVELMTIHKAKGLEFETVILPGLGKPPKRDDPPLLVQTERACPEGTDLLIAPISARRNGDTRIYDFITRENEAEAKHESERLLYVACTRAKTRLHLIGHTTLKKDALEPAVCDPASGSLLVHLWPAVRNDFEQALGSFAERPSAIGAARKPRLLRRIRIDALPLEPETPETEIEAARIPAIPDRTAAIAGTLTHRLLDRISRDGVEHWSENRIAALLSVLRISLAAEGVAADAIEPACQRIEAALIRTISDEKGRWILARHAEARNEFAVSAIVDGELRHLILDRTFVSSDGVRWIVDYKTSEPEGEGMQSFLASEKRGYQSQLEQYAAALARLDARPIRAGLYFPAIGGWVEWDPFPAELRAPHVGSPDIGEFGER